MNGEGLDANRGDLNFGGEIIGLPRRVVILDAGAQYVDLIKKSCERLGFQTDILPLETNFEEIEGQYGAFIVSGGPGSSHQNTAPMPDPKLWDTQKGVLGICYGQQAMASAFGGKVETGILRKDGTMKTEVDNSHPLFGRVKTEVSALFTHGDFVTEVPKDFAVIGSHEIKTESGSQEVVSALARNNMVGVQFHPEVFDETPFGYDIFRGFLEDMCGLEGDPTLLENFSELQCETKKAAIAEQAGGRHVIAFASGGIDSTVATLLAGEVIDPEKLHVYYFDNGFMRDEDDNVIEMLEELGIKINKIDATEIFEQATIEIEGVTYGPLIDVSDPKIKRKIIGKTFADLKDSIAGSLGLDTSEVMLLQGTNAADRIESGHSIGGTQTEQIKEHHNQVKEIKDMEAAGLLVEPLNDLHKDEIRRLAEYLGLPDEVAWRQPFPGPGNAIRILCGNEKLYNPPDLQIQSALEGFLIEINPSGLLTARLLPAKSVGVGGDSRSYIQPVALQGPADWQLLERLTNGENTITDNFRSHINRVVYALGPASLEEMSLTNTTLGRPERLQLRQADHIVFEEMRRFGLIKKISQCPVILLPLGFGEKGTRSIVLRPVTTSTFLTAKAMFPGRDVDPEFIILTATRILSEVPGINQVFLDITNKPPATTEWE